MAARRREEAAGNNGLRRAAGDASVREGTIMKHSVHITIMAVAVAVLSSSSAAHASGGSCRPRTLTAAEKQAGARVLARLRPLLPSAPAGWKIDGADATDIASGSCIDANTHKSEPQPVTVQVRRRFVRDNPPPPTAATPAPAPTPP